MSNKKFGPGDVFVSRVTAYPKMYFYTNSGSVEQYPEETSLYDLINEPASQIEIVEPSNYFMWVSARDINGNGDGNSGFTEGSNVNNWVHVADSNYNEDFTIAGAAPQSPTYSETELNGLPAVVFPGIGEVELLSAGGVGPVSQWKRFHTDPWTMFIIFKPHRDIPTGSAEWIFSNEEGALVGRRGFGFGIRTITSDSIFTPPQDTNNAAYAYVLNNTTTAYTNLGANNFFSANEICLAKVKMGFTGSSGIYKNNTLQFSTSSVGSPDTVNDPTYQVRIGGRAHATTSNFSGAIGDILLFDRFTTDEEDVQIYNYFLSIYGGFG